MNEQLKKLYKSVILEHDKHPVHYEKKEDSSHVLEAYNEICGDKFRVFFEVKNGIIREVAFHGYGCAISKASTSVLVKKLENQPLSEASRLVDKFLATVTPGTAETPSTDEEFTAFSAARDFPGRLKCATLAWDEMKTYLHDKTNNL